MVKKDEESDIESEVVDTVIEVPKKTKQIEISLEKYFDEYYKTIHMYTRAFVSANYRGILKTKDEWDTELTGQF